MYPLHPGYQSCSPFSITVRFIVLSVVKGLWSLLAQPSSFHDEISWMSKRMYLNRVTGTVTHVEACRFLCRTGMYDVMNCNNALFYEFSHNSRYLTPIGILVCVCAISNYSFSRSLTRYNWTY